VLEKSELNSLRIVFMDKLKNERAASDNAEPRGRKSLPTKDSRTEDLPEDWEPTTTI
jgi:hypothetical protein